MKKRIIIYLLILFSVFMVKDVRAVQEERPHCIYNIAGGRVWFFPGKDNDWVIKKEFTLKARLMSVKGFSNVSKCPKQIYEKHVRDDAIDLTYVYVSTVETPEYKYPCTLVDTEVFRRCNYENNGQKIFIELNSDAEINYNRNGTFIKTDKIISNVWGKPLAFNLSQLEDTLIMNKCPTSAVLNTKNNKIYFSDNPSFNDNFNLSGSDSDYVDLIDRCKNPQTDEEKASCGVKKKNCDLFNQDILRLNSLKKFIQDASKAIDECYADRQYTMPKCSGTVINSKISEIRTNINTFRKILEEAKNNSNVECADLMASLKTYNDFSVGEMKDIESKIGDIEKNLGSFSKEDAEAIQKTINQLQADLKTYLEKPLIFDTGTQEDFKNCEGIIGPKGIAKINEIFGYIKILAPILLILFGTLDFGKAVLADDKDALSKATKKFILRAIAVVAIFFIPLIVNIILTLVDNLGMGDGNLTCGIK